LTHSAIFASQLCFSYDKTEILSHANLEINSGEFIGIVGPNGGGKTTLLKLIMGLISPTSGFIHVFGKAPFQARHRIGYVPQANYIDRDFPITVLDLIMLGSISNSFCYPPHTKEKALALMDEFSLIPYRSKAFSSLSGGLAQKALLARALLSDPDVLCLDEPTANIDAASKIAISERLGRLKKKKTILLVTHDLHLIAERVDRILCVQTEVTSYLPKDVCEHFALGLYCSPQPGDRK